MELPNFLAIKGQSFVFKEDGTFKFYIPEKYFSTKLAELNGEFVKLFGICTYAIFDKNDKPKGGLHEFNYPVCFLTKPDDIEIVKDLVLTKNTDKEDYRVLKYYKDGVIVVNYEISECVDDLDTFYRALQYGNIPNTIPYDKLQDYFLNNVKLTGNGYNVSLQLIGVVLSEMCRNPKCSEQAFRLSKTNDMTDYRMCNIREIPRTVSPFTSLTSETWDEAVVNSIITKSTTASPLEKIMMD